MLSNSVVTSISVLTEDDPESVRKQYERDYKKYSVESMQSTVTQPKFKFYLYNEEGDLVQEELSIHDIQHFFLHTAYNINNQDNIFSQRDSAGNLSMDRNRNSDLENEGTHALSQIFI